MKLKLLDLFCGAGGASMGYHRAGFDVVSVDIAPQPRYPFRFIQEDAIQYLAKHWQEYDVIHASPPCQRYSSITPDKSKHPNLIPLVREMLVETGKPYIIENVPGAKDFLKNPIMLCGTMFGLDVIRHRLFECNPVVWFAPRSCSHQKKAVNCGRNPNPETEYHSIAGHFPNMAYAKKAMGIDWMNRGELAESIPPGIHRMDRHTNAGNDKQNRSNRIRRDDGQG